ncbi:UDP-glucose 4-epimerase GalE [Pseudonocardia sp. HH130629-09]|uniref:UDP-glucose 4-epimerase GalE n=1 Tax=Pseudonocardia sp. HH130629-09 TaxID=1641402 RepID=UPI0009EA83D1
MRVLVTGGAGYIGSFVVDQLICSGHDVHVLDDLSAGRRGAVRPESGLSVTDIRDTASVQRVFSNARPDAVIHLAALKSVSESFRAPGHYQDVNVAGTESVLEAAAHAGIGALVFSSTCGVYGNADYPTPESHPVRPLNPYAQSKADAETAVQRFSQATGCRSAILRFFNVSGAQPERALGHALDDEQLIPRVLDSVLNHAATVTINGNDYPTHDGTPVRDFVHVADVAAAHLDVMSLLIASRWPGGTLNVGRGQGSSVKEIVEMIRFVAVPHLSVRLGPRRPGDPAAAVADVSRILEVAGWRATRDLRSIVSSAWAWHSGESLRVHGA